MVSTIVRLSSCYVKPRLKEKAIQMLKDIGEQLPKGKFPKSDYEGVYSQCPNINKFRGIYYINEEDVVEFNRRFDGTPMKGKWTGEEKFAFVPRRLPKGDTPGLSSHIPVFSSLAATVLGDFLESSGELLPIICDKEKHFLFNVTRVIDSLDEANSELKLFDDGEIMYIRSLFLH